MSLAYQYDLFQEPDEHAEINARLDKQKDSLRRTQKRFFGENKEMMKIILDMNKQIEGINTRLNNLISERPK